MKIIRFRELKRQDRPDGRTVTNIIKQELIKNNKVLGDTIKILLDNIFPIYEKRKLEVSK